MANIALYERRWFFFWVFVSSREIPVVDVESEEQARIKAEIGFELANRMYKIRGLKGRVLAVWKVV